MPPGLGLVGRDVNQRHEPAGTAADLTAESSLRQHFEVIHTSSTFAASTLVEDLPHGGVRRRFRRRRSRCRSTK